jgi:hypothetical protein
MIVVVGLGLLIAMASACSRSGSASSSEDANPPCLYEPTRLADPDVVPAGFDRTPRRIFAPAVANLRGATSRGAFELNLTPRYEELVALYDGKKQDANCKPLLRVPVTSTLALGAGTPVHLTGAGRLELRAGVLLAGVAFSTPSALAPRSAEPIQNAHLLLNLTALGTPAASSEWRWTIVVDCAGGVGCTSPREIDEGHFALNAAL